MRGSDDRSNDTPVTVKHRIGIDQRTATRNWATSSTVCRRPAARPSSCMRAKAWLQGLSPKKPRDTAAAVHGGACLETFFPQYEFVINGGFKTLGPGGDQL